jgi:hypothetical protein
MTKDAQRIKQADNSTESTALVEVHNFLLFLDTWHKKQRQDQTEQGHTELQPVDNAPLRKSDNNTTDTGS